MNFTLSTLGFSTASTSARPGKDGVTLCGISGEVKLGKTQGSPLS